MTSQGATPRGHHPSPRRGVVLGTELELGALSGFQRQGKTPGETKFLTSMLVKEGSIGSSSTVLPLVLVCNEIYNEIAEGLAKHHLLGPDTIC
jgi:hypothetical protein